MGVFAPLTGVIGASQAMEAIKLLAGVGESLNGKLQVVDAKLAEWRTVRVKKDPACAVCTKREDSAAGR
jgi:adenylyltransferase/sulfurtransferase